MVSKEKPVVWLDLDTANDDERVEAAHLFEEHARLIACRVAGLLRKQQATIIPEYITAREAARMISVPVRTLQNWRARDDGPPFMSTPVGN